MNAPFWGTQIALSEGAESRVGATAGRPYSYLMASIGLREAARLAG